MQSRSNSCMIFEWEVKQRFGVIFRLDRKIQFRSTMEIWVISDKFEVIEKNRRNCLMFRLGSEATPYTPPPPIWGKKRFQESYQ